MTLSVSPVATRDGRVLIPTTWNVLAWAILELDDRNAARELAEQIIDAARAGLLLPEPTPDLDVERIS